jgi:tetratricopeptide (TPR) repeat protein
MKKDTSREAAIVSNKPEVTHGGASKSYFPKILSRKKLFFGAIAVLLLAVLVVSVTSYLDRDNDSYTSDPLSVTNSIENQIKINSEEANKATTNEEKITSLLFLASDYRQSKQYDNAITQYKAVLVIDSNNQQALGGLILCYTDLKDATNSILYLERMISLLESRSTEDQELLEHYKTLLEGVRRGEFTSATAPVTGQETAA